MSPRIAFASAFEAVPLAEDAIVLVSEYEHHALHGRVYKDLAPLLSRGANSSEIVGALQDRHAPGRVLYALARLRERGFVVDAAESTHRAQEAFWSLLPRARDAKEPTRFGAILPIGLDFAPVSETFRQAGIKAPVHPSLESARATEGALLVLVDSYLRRDVRRVAEEARAAGRTWFVAKPIGTTLWLGPLFDHADHACWRCLEARLRGNAEVDVGLQCLTQSEDVKPRSIGATERSLALAGTWLAHIEERLTYGALDALRDLVTLDFRTLETQRHAVTRRPQCAGCGSPVLAPPQAFAADAVVRSSDGGLRSRTPEETVAALQRQVSPITGVVRRVREMKVGDSIHVAVAAQNNGPEPCASIAELRERLDAVSAGKGRTQGQARASAICEAIERFSGIYDGTEPKETGRLVDREGAIHPNDCMLFSATQFRGRDAWNTTSPSFLWVPNEFDPHAQVAWSPARSLVTGKMRWLPTALCFYDCKALTAGCVADSNGCAAGNTLDEAAIQGFLELVERDSVALWWYNRASRPGVDLTSFDDDFVRALVPEYAALGRGVHVLDLTTDLGVPSFAAVSALRETGGRILFGFGAHFDAGLALSRALAELNQFLPFADAPMARAKKPGADAIMDRWLREATLENQPYLLPSSGSARRRGDFAPVLLPTVASGVRACAGVAERAGVDLLVVDQTRPDVGLSVARVVAPGLRHFWARFGPGRLFDVPVRLGWLPAPRREDELNPIPMFV